MAVTARRKGRPAEEAELSPEAVVKLYRDMLLIRRFEEKAGQLYGMGLIGGFCHLYIGQEAVVVGMQSAIERRRHGHHLLSRPWPYAGCGMDPKGVMAELTGRRGGYSKGKGGSMHMFSREKNFYGGHGIVGAQVPIGTGLGFRHTYSRERTRQLTYFGDGAANQGQVYESFNMAALWKLPVVYIIENNRYGMGTSVERASARHRALSSRRGLRHSGRARSTAWTCWRCGRRARRRSSMPAPARVRYILEMQTYRYRGHSMSDPAKYRSKEEVAQDAPGTRSDRPSAQEAAR